MDLLFPPRPEDFKFAEAKSPRLRIITYSDSVRTIVIRGITKTGLIHDTYLTNDDRSPQIRTIALTEIPLTILIETPTTLVQRGQLYCIVYLEFANVPGSLLVSDYITTSSSLTWPGGHIRSSTEGRGAIRRIPIPNPAAGQNIFFNVPSNTIWRLNTVSFSLQTSVTVATREAYLTLLDGASLSLQLCRASTTQIANLLRYYTFCNYNFLPAEHVSIIAGQLVPLDLLYNYFINIRVTNLNEDDQILNTIIHVEQWHNP